MSRYVYLHHPSSLDHDTGAHPERADRIRAIEARLDAERWFGFEREAAPAVSRDVLERVHPASYVDSIDRASAAGGSMLDMDTVASAGSFDAALHAAGAAARAVDLLLSGDAGVTFCALRPPGHHALSTRAMGFCLFNNVAIAAAHAVAREDVERVAVLDWDVHHGNGTNDIFYEDESVLYISIHQAPLYPGSGSLAEDGGGSGAGYTLNLPVPAGSGEGTYFAMLEQVVGPAVRAYAPQLLLVSAGYDAHRDDPLAECSLESESFGVLASAMRALSEELQAPLGFLLEGGYDLDALSDSVAATMRCAKQPAPIAGHANGDLAVAGAREHHGRRWRL